MNPSANSSLIAQVNIHIQRIDWAVNELKSLFPLTPEKVLKLTTQDMLCIELFTNRFAKLQDLLGRKLFDVYLIAKGENVETWGTIDKVNKLEKMEVIRSADVWKEMREIRNHFSHEYPDHPEITADYLNTTYKLVPELLNILSNIKAGL